MVNKIDRDFGFRLSAARLAFRKGFKVYLRITKNDIAFAEAWLQMV